MGKPQNEKLIDNNNRIRCEQSEITKRFIRPVSPMRADLQNYAQQNSTRGEKISAITRLIRRVDCNLSKIS